MNRITFAIAALSIASTFMPLRAQAQDAMPVAEEQKADRFEMAAAPLVFDW